MDRAYLYMGAHPKELDSVAGYMFRVWAPNAKSISVIGEFNDWDRDISPMVLGKMEGCWELFIEGVGEFEKYKYSVEARSGDIFDKADPYAFHSETRPFSASKTYDINNFRWTDSDWMTKRSKDGAPYNRPMSIYELHLGSWKKHQDGADGVFYDYTRIGDELIPYVLAMGFTHVEFLPVMEHPLDASWGYQCTGYFAPTSRHGTPKDFMKLIDRLHAAGIGVILDWVPAHFPKDGIGLIEFDGSPLYESEDPQMREQPDWGTRVFDYSKPQVVNFLISSAYYWLDYYHVDGLRIDAVASMLYLDYGRKDGQWKKNKYGGRENLEAVEFLKKLNEIIFRDFPSVIMAAEESTDWPSVTKPVHSGGLGFNFKWNMGWMNDMLHYIELDPILRQHNHKDITFSFMYAFSENYLLPISHDEVVHGKKSLIDKMPGTYEEKFAGVRSFLLYMFAHPGKKLLFMGQEFGQFIEWNFDNSLDWLLLNYDKHRMLSHFVAELNRFYRCNTPLWQMDYSWQGFEWICHDDKLANTVSFIRRDNSGDELLVAVNFSPVFRDRYRLGVPGPGMYTEVFNTDAPEYGGSGKLNKRALISVPSQTHGRKQHITLDLPPLGAVIIKRIRSLKMKRGEEK